VSEHRRRGLRRIAARGVLINGMFLVGLNFLNLIKGFVAAGLLSTTDYGIWGILSITLIAMLWLKDMGVSDKFVQQEEDDQERAFQEAFSVNLVLTGGLFVLMAAAMPLLAWIYGRDELILPGIVLALLLPGLALQAPIWAHWREMRFLRQRALQSIDPLLSFVLTIVLAIAGAGYWSFIISTVAGTWITALVALRSSPYPIRWRMSRRILRSYFHFSWPLFVGAFNGLVITQLSVFAGEAELGLVGVAAITLASTVVRYSQRLDDVISSTLYPVVARVQDRSDLLMESFEKSNRLALIWATPFGLAFALFSTDLIHFALGAEWEPAIIVHQLIGVAAVFNQIGFNWTAYYRARGETHQLAIASWIALAFFLAVVLPLIFTWGLEGYGVGMLAMSVLNSIVRGHYLRRIFPKLRVFPHALRAMAPTLPAVAVILLLRVAEDGERTLSIALGELALFIVLSVVAALRFERTLMREILGYLRRARPEPPHEPEVAAP